MIWGAIEFHDSDATRPDGGSPSTRRVLDEMLHAVLASGEVAQGHLFSDMGPMPARTLDLQRDMDEGRIVWKHLALLPKLVEENPYVFIIAGDGFGPVAAMRNAAAAGGGSFPICGVVHSLPLRDMLGWLALGVLRSERYDVMLTTSRAGRDSLGIGLEITRDLLDGCHIKRQMPWIEQIPLAVDTESFKPRDKRYCRETIGLPIEQTVLLCSGEAARGRRVDLEPLFVAVRDILSGDRDVIVVVADTRDNKHVAEVEALARQIGVHERVKILADVPLHARPLVCAAADVFISVDHNIHPASGLSELEAMASGVPVIGADWNGLREVIEDGATGFLIPTLWNPFAAVMMSWLSIGESAPQFLADRTALDVRALRERIDVLVSRPEHRAEMGGQARKYVEVAHAHKIVARHIADVWRRQRRECEEDATRSQIPPIADFTRLFRHYASSELRAESVIGITMRGKQWLGDGLRAPDTTCIPPLLKHEGVRILESVRSTPVSVKECIARGSEFTFEAIMWLLKKAYMHLDEA